MSNSRYPYILFFRHYKYASIDNFIESNKDAFMCSFHIINDVNELNKLYNPNYHILITYGNYEEYQYYILPHIPSRFCKRWIHKQDISNIEEFNKHVNYCYISNVIDNRENTRPVFSIFTTCYKSYEYINTAYESIKKQTLKDWEWVIMDDTPEDDHFTFLKKTLANDNRVRLYKRDKNSGNIGNVKNEVISLCRGKYILEMDHDDEILKDCLSDSFHIFESDPEVGFVYGDTINLFRNGQNAMYGENLCKGYSGYYSECINNYWGYVYNTPNINNITLSHLTCLPNHPRIWKRSVLMELESYSEFLPICDDYEILLRTCCSKYKVVKNNKAQYIQYMNDKGNNFSTIRNAEINRIGPVYISPMFYEKYGVHDKMKQLDAYENPIYITHHSDIWKRGPEYQHKRMNSRINMDYNKQYCIINDAIDNDRLKELYNNDKNDFLFLSNKLTLPEVWNKLNSLGFYRMKCYSYKDCTEEELVNFFHMMYKNDHCDYEIITNNIEEITSSNQRIFIIHNNKNGRVEKYINDIIRLYDNQEYIFIKNKEMLYNMNYNNKDILFIQNLLYCDIQINDIISIHDKYKFSLFISIHDFIWLCQEQHQYTNDIPSAYLNNNINISQDITNLLLLADKVIMNSQFTYDIYSRYFDTSNFIMCYPNDYNLQFGIKNIPEIQNKCVNIGVFSPLCKFKGERYVNYLKSKYECDTIQFQIVGHNIPYYNENEFYDFIRKYNINGFLLLNEWGETYGYLLTKIINSGLPLLYNNFGAVKERLSGKQENMEHYFKVYDNEYNGDVNIDYTILESQFNKYIEYINNNAGTVGVMNEDMTIQTRPVYNELFLPIANVYQKREIPSKKNNYTISNNYYLVDYYHFDRGINFLTYPINNCPISKVISENNVWESHMHKIFEKYISKDSIVLEGGCHIGTHTLKLALLSKRVLAFEPMIKSNAILQENLKINNINNVTVYGDGLSNKLDVAYFEWIGQNNPGASGLSNNPMGVPNYERKINKSEFPVNLITIDSLQLEKLDFIKLDVEGYELNVIEGAINTIKKCNPIITLEIWKNHFGEYSLEHAKNHFKILINNGYAIEHIKGPDFIFLPPTTPSNKEQWTFYCSLNFKKETIQTYIDNLNFIYPDLFIYLTNNRDDLLVNKPNKVTFVYEVFDSELINKLSNTEFSFINTEPLNLKFRLDNIIKIFTTYPNWKYYDNSKSNLKILEENKINIQDKTYLPYTCGKDELSTLINFNAQTKKDYDFGIICGAASSKYNKVLHPRRKRIVDYITTYFKVNQITGWENDRDNELAKCKFILNIHADYNYEPINIFEHIRCDRLLEAGFNVLSETSYKLDEQFVNKYPNLKQIDYEDFFNVDKINHYIDIYPSNNYNFSHIQRKIIDCFIFYNELDMLTYRLNILNEFVDCFVLVEATHTFVGKEKPLFYQENKHLFEKFNHKIIHIIVDDFPHKYPDINIGKNEQWNNEKFQRNCISRGIDKLELNNDDFIIIADVDEIPNPKTLEQIKNDKIIVDINTIELDFYYYNLNCKMNHKWYHTKILTFNKYKELNICCDDIRFYDCPIIKNAGWHLSYFGNEKFIKNKLENFSHQEYNKVEFTEEKIISERIKNGKDLFDRENNSILYVPIEDNNNLPPKYDVYLTNFYTDSIQNIGFFVRHFSERGTEIAIYDYAHYNEYLLKNKSYIIYFSNNAQKKYGFPDIKDTFTKFNSRFEMIQINDITDMEHIIKNYKLNFFYTLTGGDPDIYKFNNESIWNKCKTIKHCVFNTLFPEGNYTLSIGNYLNYKFNTSIPVLPHIVDLPNIDENLRDKLNIPEGAIVIGRYGGFHQFDISIAHNAIKQFLDINKDNNIYFLFMNTFEFYHHQNIIYLKKNTDMIYKTKFINTCNAMIHARSDGETFGLSIAEFSIKNKPIITSRTGDLEHILLLKDKAVIYNNTDELINIFLNIEKIILQYSDWNAYKDYTPEKVMKIFDNIISN